VDAIESSVDGFLMLCPFEITGEGCPSDDAPGYITPSWYDLYIMCELLYVAEGPDGRKGRQRGCIIDCPGTHFEVEENSSLTIDSFTITGSMQSAIKVLERGSLNILNSYLEE
jgi:hypothetical protein